MELKVMNGEGKIVSLLAGQDGVFDRAYNESLVHQVIVAYQANARSGNRKQKDREEVRHSTKKPFKQKGTGQARAGMTSSPLWRGGGRIFPNSPEENFSHKVNRKMHRAGIAAILSQLLREDRLLVIEELSLSAPKTKLLFEKLKAMGIQSALILTDSLDEKLSLASRNLANVLLLETHQMDPVSLVRFPKVVLTKSAVAQVEEMLL
jgi:large subunit ribosomal protein L4